MLEKGKRIPAWTVTDWHGEVYDLSAFRQKSHVVLLFEPAATNDTRKTWETAVRANQKQWDWLNAKVLILTEAPADLTPGAYVIDRYGMFWNQFSSGQWSFDDLEKDLVYYEARHC